MANKYDDFSEEQLIAKLDQGYEGEEDLAEIMAALSAKGVSGGFIGFSGDNEDEFKVTAEYIEYHDKIRNKSSEKEITAAMQVLSNKKSDDAGLKKALITLAHTGELNCLKALEKYFKISKGELKIWAQIAVDECKMFLESKLFDEPRLKVITHSENSSNID